MSKAPNRLRRKYAFLQLPTRLRRAAWIARAAMYGRIDVQTGKPV